MRYYEYVVTHPSSEVPPPYIRAHLDLCIFKTRLAEDAAAEALHPYLTIYETGDIHVTFRLEDGGQAVSVDTLIRDKIGLREIEYSVAVVPRGIARLAPHALPGDDLTSVGARLRRRRLMQVHDLAVKQWEVEEEGVALSLLAPNPSSPERLHRLALTIFSVVEYVAAGPREGLAHVLLGEPRRNELGGKWYGRPTVILIRHENQKDTADENESAHAEIFGRILAGVPATYAGIGRRFLVPNSRTSGDYGAYIGEAVSLYVWSAKGLRNCTEGSVVDAHGGYLVFAYVVQSALLELGHIMHRRLAEQANRSSKSLEGVLRAERDLLHLQPAMAEVTHFAEVRQLLAEGWNRMGVPNIRQFVRERLEVQRAEAALIESRSASRRSTLLAVVFGLVAIPPLAADVVGPALRLLGWPLPEHDDVAKLVLNLVAAVLVLVVVLLLQLPHLWRQRGG